MRKDRLSGWLCLTKRTSRAEPSGGNEEGRGKGRERAAKERERETRKRIEVNVLGRGNTVYLDLVTLPTVVRNAKGDFTRLGERGAAMFRVPINPPFFPGR